MGEGRRAPKAPKTRLSQEKRERFLEVLGQTGNRLLAAEAIGVEPRLMDQRREFDPLLDRQWREAMGQAQRRLAGASGPLDCIGGDEPMVIRRGPDGKLRMVKAGPRRWSGKVEERFFGHLAATGNIAASARAVGFSLGCIYQRRRNAPGFEERLQQALEDAELEIEFGLAQEVRGADRRHSSGNIAGSGAGGASGDAALDPRFRGDDEGRALDGRALDRGQRSFDIDSAIRFLKWREEKRRGGGRRGRAGREPSPDEVAEKVIRKVAAIKRHRARDGKGGGPK